MAKRTRREMQRRLIGLDWLGNATLEEYAVGVWMEQNKVTYIYQALLGGYRAPARVDFLILNMGTTLVFQIQGDHFHEGIEDVAFDRQQRLRMEEQGATVIEIWGHAIVEYTGWPVPTDESFEKVMKAAMNMVQLSHRNG